MTTTTLAPGCNMPCISHSPEHPGLWAYAVEATGSGLLSALGDEAERLISDDRFQHLVFFPTWSQGEIVFFPLHEGEKIVIDATSDSDLSVTSSSGDCLYTTKEQILVVFHGALDFEEVKDFYANP